MVLVALVLGLVDVAGDDVGCLDAPVVDTRRDRAGANTATVGAIPRDENWVAIGIANDRRKDGVFFFGRPRFGE